MTRLAIDDWTLPELVRRQAAKYGDRVFCTFADDPPLTFAQFDTESDSLASAFAGLVCILTTWSCRS